MPKAPEAIPQKRLTVGVWHCQHRLQSPRKPLEQVFSKIQTTECKISVSLVAPSWNAPAGTTVFEGRPPLWTAWRSHILRDAKYGSGMSRGGCLMIDIEFV